MERNNEINDDINNVASNINFEGLYLIHIRECVMKNSNIYKIGRSNNLANRIYQYPNSSIVYLLIECPDSKKHESELINLFTSKYKLKKFYGNEYFEGELESMKQDIISYVKTHYNVFRIVNNPFNIYRYTEDGLYVLPNDRAIKNITVETVKTVNTDNLVIEDNNADGDDDGDDDDNGDVGNADDNDGNNDGDNGDNSGDAAISNTSNNNGYKTCDNCGTEFKFPCQLERHLNSKRKCKSKDNQIKDYDCEFCKCNYSNKYSLTRHLQICKANNNNLVIPINTSSNQEIVNESNNIDVNNAINAINNICNMINTLIDTNNGQDYRESIKNMTSSLKYIIELGTKRT